MSTHTRPTAKRGTRMGWVPVTIKLPPRLADTVARAAKRLRRNRSEYIYRLLLEATHTHPPLTPPQEP